ncbi:thiamine pyrophosphate-dependent enzyme [Nonomuraea sp. NPDC049158]|uniref:thiamine pyrophosphate-dependent enzyme n=1 Tax=Nonomuraea sp. NPDC049158 TaxID=3155649 RepID=UPI0033DFF7D7
MARIAAESLVERLAEWGVDMLMAEFLTAAQQRLPVKVVINNNRSLGQILWEQMVLGYPEHGVRFPEPAGDFAGWARGCGGIQRLGD